MSAPVVAIVGRPNVGKSSLFNSLARRRISIVEPTSGVTRDRVSTVVRAPDGAELELVDTGGMGVGDLDTLAKHVEEQIRLAVARADVLVLVVDAKDGLMPQDRQIAATLRRLGKPIVLAANKVDAARDAAVAAEFHRLGLGEPFLVSAVHKRNVGELRERLFELAGAVPSTPAEEPEMKIAIVGQRNVGKSTFINTLAREERVIVSELPGTTRDSIDVRIEQEGKAFVAIDTAGLRRLGRTATSIEFYSRVRAEQSVRRADVVLLMLDPHNKVSQVDKKLADYIAGHYKPCIIVVNKWDLAGTVRTGDFAAYVNSELPLLSHAPMCFISALENKRVGAAIDVARSLWKQARIRVSTGRLNAVMEELKTRPHAGGRTSRRAKLYYATQVAVAPPTVVLFVNSPALVTPGYRRAILGFLRQRLPFAEIPVLVRYERASGGGGR